MYSWARETGANWDLNIATRTLRAAFDHLIGGMPATGHALISFIGDLFDYDGMEPVTPTSRNILDVDGRFMKMAELGIDAILYAIDRTLSHHSRVEIKFVPGNHDPSLMRLMSLFVRTIYRDEPRVSVDVTPGQFRYHRFGKNLRGFCHGHEVKKLSDLALIMATDRPDDWAASTYRTWHTGHRHKHEILDEQGVRIETAPVLCPLNAWAHSNGFRGLRAMQAILQHREDGEIARFTVNPSMMR